MELDTGIRLPKQLLIDQLLKVMEVINHEAPEIVSYTSPRQKRDKIIIKEY